MAAAVVVTMVTAANGLSFFLFSSVVADAEITVPAANLINRRRFYGAFLHKYFYTTNNYYGLRDVT